MNPTGAPSLEPLLRVVVEAASRASGLAVEDLDRAARRAPLELGPSVVERVRGSLADRFGCMPPVPLVPGELDVPAMAVALGESYRTSAGALGLPFEYGILLLKPDAEWRGLEERLPALLQEFGLDVVERIARNLDPEIVPSLTHRRDPETLSYLSSGSVQILLVRGRDALERTYRLKHRAREALGVHNEIHNLVHACDAGNEMALFLRTFFPARDEMRFRGSVDQVWLAPGLAELKEGIEAQAREHPAGVLIPVIDRDSPNMAPALDLLARHGQPFLGVRERVPLAGSRRLVEVVRYLRRAGSRSQRSARALVGPGDLLRAGALRQIGGLRDQFDFVLCYHPAWSLERVEELNELARSEGIVPVCGSGASARPFVLANSAAGMREFESAVMRRAWWSRPHP